MAPVKEVDGSGSVGSLRWAVAVFSRQWQSSVGSGSLRWAVAVFGGQWQSPVGSGSLQWAVAVFSGSLQFFEVLKITATLHNYEVEFKHIT
ncbi:MAG: hypothetical protein WBG71_14810 [Leeuwenhoekiella sp.]